MLKMLIRRTFPAIFVVMMCFLTGLASRSVAADAPEAKSKESGSALWSEDSAAAEDEDEGDRQESKFNVTGLIRNKLGYDLKEDNEVESELSNHSEFQIGVKYVPHDRFHALLSLDVDYLQYKNNSDWDYDDTVRLHNAYVNWGSSLYNLKVGNQIVRWGKTDGFSPLDNLNPEDYRDGIAGRREDRKIPIPMVNLELYRGKFSIQGVYIPVFVEPELDIVGTDWAFFQHGEKEVGALKIFEEDPSNSLNNSEVGVRIAGIVRHVNVALSWFQTREDLPFPDSLILPPGFSVPAGELRMTDLLVFSQLTGQTIHLKHDRQNIFGFEVESTLGDFGVRGDVAYFDHSSYLTRSLQRERKPTGQCMVGLDYNGSDAWYANIQYLQSYIFNYDERIVWVDEFAGAITGTVSKEFFNGNFKPECRFFYDFSGNAAMLNPKLIFNNWEPFIVELGVELFDGTEETPLGIFGENDLVYAQFQLNF